MVSEGIERRTGNNWQEALIPEKETLIGFKVMNLAGKVIFGLAPVTAKYY